MQPHVEPTGYDDDPVDVEEDMKYDNAHIWLDAVGERTTLQGVDAWHVFGDAPLRVFIQDTEVITVGGHPLFRVVAEHKGEIRPLSGAVSAEQASREALAIQCTVPARHWGV